MNKYSLVSAGQKSLGRKPMPEASGKRRVRLSVTRWQQAKFVPVIVSQGPVSRRNFFNS